MRRRAAHELPVGLIVLTTSATCDIWIVSIHEFTEHRAALDRVLTIDERAHVERFRSGRATARVSRGLLRLLLARYLDLSPQEIEIDRGCPACGRPHGKPRLVGRRPAGSTALHFSVAHGGDLLLIAVTGDGPVGVDVEPLGAASEGVPPELEEFALTPAERRRVDAAGASQRLPVFLRYWTAKEAALKALGTGLDTPPGAVSVSAPRRGDARPVLATVAGSPALHLQVREIDVGPAYVCALATRRRTAHVGVRRLSPRTVFGGPAGATASRSPHGGVAC